MSLSHKYYKTLPRWGKRLNRRFIAAFGKPAGLWMPNDVTNKAYDFSSNRNIGTLNGGVTTSGDGVVVLGQSWKYGAGSFFKISSPPALVGPLTAFCSFNTTDAITTQILLSYDAGSNSGWRIELFNGQITFTLGSIKDYVFSTLDPTVNSNSFIAVSWTGNGGTATCHLGVNGVISSESQTTGTMAGTPSQITIGGVSWSSFSLLGRMGIVGIFQEILSKSQVSDLYSSLLYGEPHSLFGPQISQRYSIRQLSGSSFRFRRTLSGLGTRTGTRQVMA